jgi:hypothetical protein
MTAHDVEVEDHFALRRAMEDDHVTQDLVAFFIAYNKVNFSTPFLLSLLTKMSQYNLESIKQKAAGTLINRLPFIYDTKYRRSRVVYGLDRELHSAPLLSGKRLTRPSRYSSSATATTTINKDHELATWNLPSFAILCVFYPSRLRRAYVCRNYRQFPLLRIAGKDETPSHPFSSSPAHLPLGH